MVDFNGNPRSCILLYGNAEARPLNIVTTPSRFIFSKHSPSTSGASDNKWRRIKRENSLRKDIHLYNKIIISGPADYIVLTASDIRESGSGAADRLQWAKQFGLESTAYDTLRFVLERVETESKNEHCDQRLKIDSLRETLRQKQPAGDKHSTVAASNSTQRSPLEIRNSSAGAQLSKAVSLPSVVLKHAISNVDDTRRQYLRNQFETSVAAVSGEDVAPVEGPIRMTRQQRKAARAFANLQHPVAAKSLGGYVQMSNKAKDDESPVADISSPTTTQCDDLLFLFPTMTKRRQLHGKCVSSLNERYFCVTH
ncbi:hypothetical protein PInf_028741 [Phytophthora infestans]|nr:hypothetical protein PInf_028741 [Phytophthora infestans]